MKTTLGIAGLGFLLALNGCQCLPPTDQVFQTSTIDALLAGVYDGEMTCEQLLGKGDLGIGTFDALDGEMVVLDGTVYQVKADGSVHQPSPGVKTPFATVCFFQGEKGLRIEKGWTREVVEAEISRFCPNSNLFYAIRLEGRFSLMKTRSVPFQKRPYPPLAEVTRHQPEFELKDVAGTVLGFRSPAFVKGLNVPGYHLHFLSEDRTQGGHILNFTVDEGWCELDELHRYSLVLPSQSTAFAETDLSANRSQALDEVERSGD